MCTHAGQPFSLGGTRSGLASTLESLTLTTWEVSAYHAWNIWSWCSKYRVVCMIMYRASPEWNDDCWGSEGGGVQHWDGGKVALGESLAGLSKKPLKSHNALLNLNTYISECQLLSQTKVLIRCSAHKSVKLNDWMVNLCTCTCGKIIALECLKLYDSCSSLFTPECRWEWHVSATQPRVWLLHGMKMDCMFKFIICMSRDMLAHCTYLMQTPFMTKIVISC